jgi:type I restriction enzyme S subunit
MRSSYDILGNHIRLIDVRNTNNVTDRVLGISIDKSFMPSVANVIGTDLSRYKLIEKGKFACNPMHVGRDERLPVALYEEETPAIVSPAYFMFEIIDETVLDTNYLMMWFRRPEFDRICWLKTDGSVRGGISWDDICRIELPIPPIEKQREIVSSYRAITDRIALKQRINDNLAATIQATFGKIFDEAGISLADHIIKNKPAPSDWIDSTVGGYSILQTGPFGTQLHAEEYVQSGTPIINVKNIGHGQVIASNLDYLSVETCNRLSTHRLEYGDIVFGRKGSIDRHAFINKRCSGWMQGSDCIRVRPHNPQTGHYLNCWFGQPVIKQLVVSASVGSTMASLNTRILSDIRLLIPPQNILISFCNTANIIMGCIEQNQTEIENLEEMLGHLQETLSR